MGREQQSGERERSGEQGRERGQLDPDLPLPVFQHSIGPNCRVRIDMLNDVCPGSQPGQGPETEAAGCRWLREPALFPR